MNRAEEQIRRFEARRPQAVRLAEAVSLAVIADPPLLRKARRDLVPGADPGTEADLWLSPLVQTRSPDGIVFASDTAEALRLRLAGDPERLEKAWQMTQALHGHFTPALRLEEEIAWLSLVSDQNVRAAERIEKLLRSVLAALVVGERRGLAHWAARALPKLPSRVRFSQTARMLEAGAHLRLRGDARTLREEEKAPDWLPWVAPADLPRVPIAVRLFEGAVEIDARPDPQGQQLQLPQTDPLLVDLSWSEPEGSKALQVTFKRGEMQKIPVPVSDVRLRTILGEIYDLRRSGTAPRGLQGWIIDFSEERARHQNYLFREEMRQIASLISTPARAGEGRLLLVTGALGTGKTALLASFVGSIRSEGPPNPHHFFRRGNPRLESLEAAERSLIAQIVQLFPAVAPLAAHLRLPEILQTLLDRQLITHDANPLMLVLDAIDEAVDSGPSGEGLLSILPERLPAQVIVLASATKGDGLRLPGPIEPVPLSDPEPALREFWRQHFHQAEENTESFVRLSAGSFAVAKVLRSWLQQTDGRGFFRAGRGAFVTIWEELEKMVGREVRDLWLGFLATAYGPLPSSLLERLTGGERVRQTLSPLLSFHGHQGDPAYELKEEVLRDFISSHLDLTQFPRNVFLSSTVLDLRPYRDAVYSAIQSLNGYLCWRFEDFEGSATELRHRIEDCDVFVSLVGHRRGTTPMDSELSYTELEYEDAKKLGKPILLFVAAEDMPLSQDLLEPDAVNQRQVAFRKRVLKERVVAFFRDPQELVSKVVIALSDLRREGGDLLYLHRRLAEVASQAIFAEDSTESAQRYGLQYAAAHWLAAREVEKTFRLVTSVDFLKARSQKFGIAAARRDLQFWLNESISPQSYPDLLRSQATDLLEGLAQIAPSIASQPAALPSFLFSHLRSKGWAPVRIRDFLLLPDAEPVFHLFELFPDEGLRHRPPARHRGEVLGCSFVDVGGPAVLSWSTDGSLRVWDVTNGTLRELLTGHTAEVTGCALLEKGRVVSSSRDGSLRMWNTHDGILVRTLWGHAGEVLGVLALDARMVVSWSTDRTIRIWDLAEGREVMALKGHEGAITACVVTPDGRSLISGSEDTTVRLWDVSSGSLVRTVRGHRGPVTGISVREEADYFLSVSQDRTIRVNGLEEADDEDRPAILEGHQLGVIGCAISPDDSLLATWSYDRTIRLWQLSSYEHDQWAQSSGGPLVQPLATLTGHDGAVLSCVFFPEGDRLVSCSADRTVRIWDVQTSEPLAVLRGHDAPVRAVGLESRPSRSDKLRESLTEQIVSGSDDRTLRIWNEGIDPWIDSEHLKLGEKWQEKLSQFIERASHGREEIILDGENETLLCLPFRNRRQVVTVSRIGNLRLHEVGDPDSGRLGLPSMLVGGGVVAPNDRLLVLWSRNLVNGQVRFAVSELEPMADRPLEFAGHKGAVLACAISPDSRALFSGSIDGSVRIWGLKDGSEVIAFEGKSPVSALQIDPSGRRGLSGFWDGTLLLWVLEGYRTTHSLTGHSDRILACAFAPDGLRAVSASADRTLRYWDLETGSTLAVLTGHTAEVTGCAFTRDARRIISRSKDGRLGLWDGGSGSLVAFTQGHTDWVNAFAIAEDEGIFYSCSEDQTVRVWDLATGEPRGVVYGASAFRSLAAVAGGVYAGDEAGNLWVLEYGEGHDTSLPGPELEELVVRRLERYDLRGSQFLTGVLSLFRELRKPKTGLLKPPTTAEFIDWVTLLLERAPEMKDPLVAGLGTVLATLSTLVKTAEDRARAEQVVRNWMSSWNT